MIWTILSYILTLMFGAFLGFTCATVICMGKR